MANKKKPKSGNPAVSSDQIADDLYGLIRRSVEMTKRLGEDDRVSKEHWEYFRGGVLAMMEVYSKLRDKPSAIGIIIKEYDAAMLCPTCAGPHRTVKGVECPTCGCPPREGM
jgi:hypothetical protein